MDNAPHEVWRFPEGKRVLEQRLRQLVYERKE